MIDPAMKSTKLRFSIQPYVGMGVACALSLVMLFIISFETKTWDPLIEFWWLPSLLFAGWVFIGTRYRIFYDHACVKMVASGLAPVLIAYSEITRIRNESSFEQGRPFRRIAIYAGDRFVDLSLKHFVIEDVRSLIGVIQGKRPDLEFPKF